MQYLYISFSVTYAFQPAVSATAMLHYV